MKECPELKDLAHFVETGEGSADLREHLVRCDACQDARSNLEEEAASLQISISELWFREQVSCPDGPTLEKYRKTRLGAEEQAYVKFHLDRLECPTCQARMGEAELLQAPSKSRRRVADATTTLLRDLRKGR